jgi:plasmid maintenance system killer protein
VEVEFGSKEVHDLATDPGLAIRKLGPKVASALAFRVQLLMSFRSEQELRAYRGFRLHKLHNRRGDYAIDIDRKWRLELSISGNSVILMEVSNHYDD